MADPIFKLPPDVRITPTSVPLSELIDWSLKFLDVPAQWRKTKGAGVKVAILDTGCDVGHTDLCQGILDASDFTRSPVGHFDRNQHGTHVAGIVGARANGTGVVGVAPECGLLIGKVLGDNGSGTDATILAGVKWAMAKDADVINLSLGGRGMSASLRAALQEFIATPGKFVFAAAGNDSGPVNEPAAFPETIAVGAVGKDGRLTKFTSRDPRLDILGPGVGLVSTVPGNRYADMTGTSMASPFVSAIGALALAKHRDQGQGKTPLQTVEDMRAALKATAKPTPDGFGLVQPGPLLDRIKAASPLPAAPLPWYVAAALAIGGYTVHQPARAGDAFSATGR